MKFKTNFLFLVFSIHLFSQTDNKKLEINHLVEGFYIFTTYNDLGNGFFPSNGMYVLTKEGALLFDTPWDTTQFQPLLDSIQSKHNKNVIFCLSTHFHEDRTGGLNYYRSKGIQTYTTQLTDLYSLSNKKNRADFIIHRDTIFKFSPYEFEVFYPGAGHSYDNIVVWFPKFRLLYGGCFIKSMDTDNLGNLSHANVTEWKKSILRVQKKYGKASYIIPGHQSWNSPKAIDHTLNLIKEYINNK